MGFSSQEIFNRLSASGEREKQLFDQWQFEQAVVELDDERVKEILERNKEININAGIPVAWPQYQVPLLHYLCSLTLEKKDQQNKRVHIAKLLIAHGANVNHQLPPHHSRSSLQTIFLSYPTPLALAIRNADIGLIATLVDVNNERLETQRANVNGPPVAALDIVRKINYHLVVLATARYEIAYLLESVGGISKETGWTNWEYYLRSGNAAGVSWLIRKGVSVNDVVGKDGMTPLALARQHEDVVRILEGAKVNMGDILTDPKANDFYRARTT